MSFKPLKKGDIVDIICPATACTKYEIEKAKKFISELGLKPRFFLEEKLALKKPASHEFPSFGAEDRFAQFKLAVENSESKIIWCMRGGYGSADILPLIQKMKKPKNKKIFIGFSDIVSLNLFTQKNWNWQNICAPMLAQIINKNVSEKSEKAIVDLLFGKSKNLKYSLISLNNSAKKEIEGKIIGGCISVLSGHFGTKNQIDWSNKILFLEDEGEDGERLERYFNQIVTIMIEQNKIPSAILLGNFLESNPHGTPKAKNIKIAIEKFIEKIDQNNLQLTVFLEKSGCLGHSKNILPLVLGMKTSISKNSLIQSL
ncbi:MAG: LD-carboxypeptidase [Pelagibacterales bacterium]|nr:LD-carboxypeptidase [Pelagibacterales bacterium]